MPRTSPLVPALSIALLGAAPAVGQTPVATWTSPDVGPAPEYFYQSHLALSGDWLVVGVKEPWGLSGRDQAVVYSVASGQPLYELLPDDDPASSFGTAFPGRAIDVDGAFALVGGADAAGGFARAFDLATGALVSEMRADDGSPTFFGESVALSWPWAVVGARGDDVYGALSGSAYVFDASTGQQLVKLAPDVGSAFDDFGKDVAIDGDRVLVGAPDYFVPSGPDGAAFVFDRATGTQLWQLGPGDGSGTFGDEVALEGDRAVLGSWFASVDGKSTSGQVFVYDASTGQLQFDWLSPGHTAGGTLGWGVDLDGGVAWACAPGESVFGPVSGVVYAFDPGTGTLLDSSHPLGGATQFGLFHVKADGTRIAAVGRVGVTPFTVYVLDTAADQTLLELPPVVDPVSGDGFAVALDVAGGLGVAGAPGDQDVGQGAGTAYLYDPATGALLDTLYGSDMEIGASFGASVGTDGTYVVVGAPNFGAASKGMAYLFDAASGVELQKLHPSPAAAQARYGSAVAVDAGRAAVRAPFNGAGQVFVFDLPSGAQTLAVPADATASPGSVALDGDALVVGRGNDGTAGSLAGAVDVWDLATGQLRLTLTAASALDGDRFGYAVAAGGGYVLVGTRRDAADPGQVGAAFVFDGATGQELFELTAPGGDDGDAFGETVAIAGRLGLVGAPGDSAAGIESGSVYAFDLASGALLAKLDGVPGDALSAGLAAEGDRIYAGAPGAGAVRVFEAPTLPPLFYCTAKTSSSGCVAQIATSAPLAQPVSGAGDYSVQATGVEAQKFGLVFAGLNGAAAIPFGGGLLCLAGGPSKRGPLLSSGGGAVGTCTGSFDVVVNDGLVIPAGLDGGAGNTVWYQWIHRDPLSGAGLQGIALSDAVQLDFQ